MSKIDFDSLYESDQKKPSNRSIGLLLVVIFAVIFGWLRLITGVTYLWLLALCALLLVIAAFRPILLSRVNQMWMGLANLLHRVVNPLILGCLFFLVFAPIGILRRISGGDPLRLRSNSKRTTYWIARTKSGSIGSNMHDQF
jgi:hypothetical protein